MGCYLLGDAAYACLDWLIPPFKELGNVNDEKRLFNKRHCGTRVHVERAFGMVKGRFRKLKYIDMDIIEDMNQVIVSCFVLHNICQICRDNCEEFFDADDCDPNLFKNIYENDNNGVEKRDRLVKIINEREREE